MNYSDKVRLLRDLGMPVTDAALPQDVYIGPFSRVVDLTTGWTLGTDIADLRDGTNWGPIAARAGWGSSASVSALFWGASFTFAGDNVHQLDPGDLAALENDLLIQLETPGARDRFFPLAGGVHSAPQQFQVTQDTAADGTFFLGRRDTGPVAWREPIYIPSFQNLPTFSLVGSLANRTFANSVQLPDCRLTLYGAVIAQTGPPTDSCGVIRPQVARDLAATTAVAVATQR